MRISDWSSDVCSSDLVLEADGIDHPGGSLPNPRFRIPFDFFARKTLHHDGAESVEIHHCGELDGVAEGAGGGDHRLLRSDERRVGTGGVSTGRSRWRTDH